MTKTPETSAEVARTLDHIRGMPPAEVKRLWRFASSGHPFFDTARPYVAAFKTALIVERVADHIDVIDEDHRR